MPADMFLRMIVALAVVLGLLAGFAYLLRRWGPRFGLTPTLPMGAGKRITIVEASMLDAKHRAVILRCDGVEHLVILGGAQPVVLPSK